MVKGNEIFLNVYFDKEYYPLALQILKTDLKITKHGKR